MPLFASFFFNFSEPARSALEEAWRPDGVLRHGSPAGAHSMWARDDRPAGRRRPSRACAPRPPAEECGRRLALAASESRDRTRRTPVGRWPSSAESARRRVARRGSPPRRAAPRGARRRSSGGRLTSVAGHQPRPSLLALRTLLRWCALSPPRRGCFLRDFLAPLRAQLLRARSTASKAA